MSVFSIDGETYAVGVVSVHRAASVLDKYANRTEDGGLSREIIGVYRNYDMTFGQISNPDEYERLFNKLTEPEEFHTIVVPDTKGSLTYTAYISSVEDDLIRHNPISGIHRWGNLTASFVARTPTSTP